MDVMISNLWQSHSHLL